MVMSKVSDNLKKNGWKVTFSIFFFVFAVGLCVTFMGLPAVDDWKLALRGAVIIGGLGCVLCFVLALILRGLRWAIFLKLARNKDNFECMLVYGAAFSLAAFTPMRVGEISRVVWLKSKKISRSYGLGTMIAERLLDLFLLLLLLSVSVAFWPEISVHVGHLPTVLFFLIFISYFVLVFNGSRIKAFFSNIFLRSKFNINKRVQVAVAQIWLGISILSIPAIRLKIAFITSVIWGMHVLGFTFFFMCWDSSLPLYSGMIVLVFVNVIGILHLTPGNVGIYEFVGSLVLEQFGLPSGEALIAMVTIHVFVIFMLIIYGGLSGLWLYFIRGSFYTNR